MEIKFNIPIEVTESQYKLLVAKCGGIIAHRKHEGKYYIKVWLIEYVDYVKSIANF